MIKNLKVVSILLLLITSHSLYADVYEASTLHNAVARSETVLGLFTDRWEINQEKNFYIDLYGKINWTYDFNVNTYNSGSGEYEATELNLVRSYGTMTLAFPVTGFRKTADENDLILAFSMAGFHYGLTKDVEIDRGDAGDETTTDYKHSQFFDDIYALSVLYRPYVYIHSGIIINQEFVPNDDGTMNYRDPEKSYKKFFISSNVLEMLGIQLNSNESDVEQMKLSLNITKVYAIARSSKITDYTPDLEITYEYIEAYNDKPWDSVWVKTTEGKSQSMSNSDRDRAKLNILSMNLGQRLTKNFTTESQLSFQYITEDIYRRGDSEKIDVSPIKEFHFLFAYEPILTETSFNFKIYTGLSWYWDPAVGVHRESGVGNDIWGWTLGLDLGTDNIGLETKVVYNYSDELRKLVETADKWSFEGSLFFRI